MFEYITNKSTAAETSVEDANMNSDDESNILQEKDFISVDLLSSQDL